MRIRLFGLTLLVAVAFMPGCGGGSHSATGRLMLTVHWPKRTKLIPDASNSIKAVLTRGTTTLGSQTLVRPAQGTWVTTVTFSDLTAGDVLLTATAFPNADGTGVAQASGSAPSSIVAGQTTNVVVTMDSTIATITLGPANPSIPVGQTVQLVATAKDASGAVVLITPSKLQWSSATPAVATVNSAGLVTGLSAGTSVITLTETESGMSANTTVTVTAAGPPPNTAPFRSVTDLTGQFMYVIDQTTFTVSQFRINAGGTLSPLTPATVTVAMTPWSLGVNPAVGSHTLYVSSTNGTNGAIFQFNINADGTLNPLNPASVTATPQPLDFVIPPAGDFLFTFDNAGVGIRSYTINANGTLTQTSVVVNQENLFSAVVTPDGKFLYVTTNNAVAQYRIDPGGALTDLGPTPPLPAGSQGMCIDPLGRFVYAPFHASNVSGIRGYTINTDGTLTQAGTDAALPGSQFPFHSAVTPDGKFLYVPLTTSVAQYAVNANGTITPLSPATVAAGPFATSVTVSRDGKFAYVTNLSDNTISQFRINADGTLTPLVPPKVNG